MVRAFAESDIEFARGRTNVPFAPIAFVSARLYSDADVTGITRAEARGFDQRAVSAMALVPVLLSKRDAAGTGLYVNRQHFSLSPSERGNDAGDFTVSSVSLPIAYFRQVRRDWQAAAFVMPTGHYSDLEEGGWSLQTLGGAFARYTQRDDLWWAFGVFGDHSPGNGYLLPYVGASWSINERWTLSAIMPWPAVHYAPTRDWLFSLGTSPSGASWNLAAGQRDVSVNLDAWDFGLNVERRLGGNFWLAARAGVSGLRGLRFNTGDGNLEDPDFDVGSSGFVSLSLKFRPGLVP